MILFIFIQLPLASFCIYSFNPELSNLRTLASGEMIAAVQRNPYKMGKLRAVLENHPILLGFANAGDYFSCSLGFFVNFLG
jgi:hypothetical protein